MSTVPGFPDATVPTPETVLLWATEGSGSTRDKKVTALQLVQDMVPGALAPAVTGLTAASTLAGTELVPVIQTTSKKVTVKNFLAQGLNSLDTIAALFSGDRLPVVDSGGTARRVPIDVFSRKKEYVTLPNTGLNTFELIGATGVASETNVVLPGSYLELQEIPALAATAARAQLYLSAAIPATTVVSSARDFLLYTEYPFFVLFGYDYPTAGVNPTRMGTVHLYDTTTLTSYVMSAQFASVLAGTQTTIKIFAPGNPDPMTYADFVTLFSTSQVLLSLEHTIVSVGA